MDQSGITVEYIVGGRYVSLTLDEYRSMILLSEETGCTIAEILAERDEAAPQGPPEADPRSVEGSERGGPHDGT